MMTPRWNNFGRNNIALFLNIEIYVDGIFVINHLLAGNLRRFHAIPPNIDLSV